MCGAVVFCGAMLPRLRWPMFGSYDHFGRTPKAVVSPTLSSLRVFTCASVGTDAGMAAVPARLLEDDLVCLGDASCSHKRTSACPRALGDHLLPGPPSVCPLASYLSCCARALCIVAALPCCAAEQCTSVLVFFQVAMWRLVAV